MESITLMIVLTGLMLEAVGLLLHHELSKVNGKLQEIIKLLRR